jgi:hypothetical protein
VDHIYNELSIFNAQCVKEPYEWVNFGLPRGTDCHALQNKYDRVLQLCLIQLFLHNRLQKLFEAMGTTRGKLPSGIFVSE